MTVQTSTKTCKLRNEYIQNKSETVLHVSAVAKVAMLPGGEYLASTVNKRRANC